MPPKSVPAKYVDVLLPIPSTSSVYTYIWEEKLGNSPYGLRVLVPFGKGKPLMGIIVKIHEKKPSETIKYRRVIGIAGDIRICECFIHLWQWAAKYYMCTLGEVYRAVETNIFPSEEGAKTKVGTKSGWIPSSRLGKEPEFYSSIQKTLSRSKAALMIVQRIYDRMIESTTERAAPTYVPSTLKYWQEYFGTTTYTIRKLKDLKVFEEVPLEAEKVSREEACLPIDHTSETLHLSFAAEKGVTLLHTPSFNIRESIPYEWIWERVSRGGQVLFLLPHSDWVEELSPSLCKLWGELFKPYTSEMPLSYRHKILSDAVLGRPGVYCGHRAAVWLPLRSLSLIVAMDEESYNYKQYEPAPRYHSVRVALMLGKLVGAPSLLVSSSPSVESMLRVSRKDYAYLCLDNSKDLNIKEVYVDLAEAYSKNRVRGRLLSFEMIEAIRQALSQKKRTLLFYHRTGYARQIVCDTCGYTFRCPSCEIPLRYFDSTHKLVCPTCGTVSEVHELCPKCGRGKMISEGTGIERLEEEVKAIFPAAMVGIEESTGETQKNYDILLSSAYMPRRKQMRRVSVVGLVRADILALMPDYRSSERLYSFLVQCRTLSEQLDTLVIQYLSNHLDAIEAFRERSYQLLYDKEVEGRYIVKYPPFSRMFEIYIEGTEIPLLHRLAGGIVCMLRQSPHNLSVYGPAPLPVRKKNASAGYKLTVFHPLSVAYAPLRQYVQDKIEECRKDHAGRIHIYYNVDP